MKLHGIVPPMVTPLRDRDTLDTAGLDRLVDHILAGGVHGLFVLGTTGEAPCLGYQLRRDLITRSCAQVRNRVPVLVGITDTAYNESLSLARHAANAGAAAVVLAPPYYFPAGQPELIEYIEHLTAELPLPLFIYNMPMMCKVVFALDTIKRFRDNPRIIGIKDSSGDMDYFHQVLAIASDRPDWSVFIGPESMTGHAVLKGAQGGVNGGANLFPRLFVDVYEAALNNDSPRLAELQQRVVAVGRIYKIGKHASAIIKGTKCALSLKGICDDFMSEPFNRFQAPERAKVQQLLDEMPFA